ncbi:unnamed protein product [Diabrotica balteata]|uniref:Uncharacterized protein n=1 Tax=Diabrotica balteata TaxID=107213 RepID=A0A9N9XE32_DIABA|nr:unnamed protein product [Diabrotica balteata]
MKKAKMLVTGKFYTSDKIPDIYTLRQNEIATLVDKQAAISKSIAAEMPAAEDLAKARMLLTDKLSIPSEIPGTNDLAKTKMLLIDNLSIQKEISDIPTLPYNVISTLADNKVSQMPATEYLEKVKLLKSTITEDSSVSSVVSAVIAEQNISLNNIVASKMPATEYLDKVKLRKSTITGDSSVSSVVSAVISEQTVSLNNLTVKLSDSKHILSNDILSSTKLVNSKLSPVNPKSKPSGPHQTLKEVIPDSSKIVDSNLSLDNSSFNLSSTDQIIKDLPDASKIVSSTLSISESVSISKTSVSDGIISTKSTALDKNTTVERTTSQHSSFISKEVLTTAITRQSLNESLVPKVLSKPDAIKSSFLKRF